MGIKALAEALKTLIGGASDNLPTLSGLSCQLATYSILNVLSLNLRIQHAYFLEKL